MRLSWGLPFISCLFLTLPCLGAADKERDKARVPASPKEQVFHWKKSSSSDGLSIYSSLVEGSEVIALKAEGLVDCPIEKVASVIAQTARRTEWVDNLASSKIVREVSPVEFIEYDQAGIPFPFTPFVSDRDFVSRVTLESNPETRRLTMTYSSTEDELAPRHPKRVRGTMYCVFKLVPMSLSDQTYVEAEIHCDPKGRVAKWMVNFFQEGWPKTTFERLRKQVKKEDVQISPVITKLLPPRQLHLDQKPEAPVPHPKRGMKRVQRQGQ